MLAVVHAGSEVQRIVDDAGAGWVVDSSDPAGVVTTLAMIARNRSLLRSYGDAALEYAQRRFNRGAFVASFERVLRSAMAER